MDANYCLFLNVGTITPHRRAGDFLHVESVDSRRNLEFDESHACHYSELDQSVVGKQKLDYLCWDVRRRHVVVLLCTERQGKIALHLDGGVSHDDWLDRDLARVPGVHRIIC